MDPMLKELIEVERDTSELEATFDGTKMNSRSTSKVRKIIQRLRARLNSMEEEIDNYGEEAN